MNPIEREAEVFKALGNATRLRILQCIGQGVSNPGEIADKLKRPRSTIEKHLRVLLRAGLVEKVPLLNLYGQLRVGYSNSAIADEIRQIFQKISNR